MINEQNLPAAGIVLALFAIAIAVGWYQELRNK